MAALIAVHITDMELNRNSFASSKLGRGIVEASCELSSRRRSIKEGRAKEEALFTPRARPAELEMAEGCLGGRTLAGEKTEAVDHLDGAAGGQIVGGGGERERRGGDLFKEAGMRDEDRRGQDQDGRSGVFQFSLEENVTSRTGKLTVGQGKGLGHIKLEKLAKGTSTHVLSEVRGGADEDVDTFITEGTAEDNILRGVRREGEGRGSNSILFRVVESITF